MAEQRRHGVFFRSSQGNEYLYDDDTGFIYSSDGELNAAPYPATWNVTPLGGRRPPPEDFNGETIRQHLLGGAYGFRHLILEVTGQCNLRCKYCVYSDFYPYNRGYNDARMSGETAVTAIDMYMTNFTTVAERNPDAKPIVGFYGGEPLLAFDVVREAVEYFNEHYPDWSSRVLFTITTNGLLMKDRVQDFLVENNFSTIVSLDGDKKEHDRNRVTQSGKGSFDVVFGNIERFKARHPDYKRLAASVVYDYKSDLRELQRFFDEKHLFVTSLSQVSATSPSYYSQFTEADVSAYVDRRLEFEKTFCEAARNNTIDRGSFLFTYAGVSMAEFAFHPILQEQRPWFVPYTGTCVPGEKLYVMPTGEIHMCERINHHFPIGDVSSGLDYERIADIVGEYNRAVCTHCKECDVTRFCNRCFATCATEDGFATDGCRQFREAIVGSLVSYVDVAEHRPEILDDITVEYYRDILDVVGYIVE